MARFVGLLLLGLLVVAAPATARERGAASVGGQTRIALGAQPLVQAAVYRRYRPAVAQARPVRLLRVRYSSAGSASRALMPGSIRGWSRDLEPAAGVQAEACPAGTMATLARGHDDIIRCLPI